MRSAREPGAGAEAAAEQQQLYAVKHMPFDHKLHRHVVVPVLVLALVPRAAAAAVLVLAPAPAAGRRASA